MNNLNLKLIIRQFARNRVFSLFNIIGFGLGLGCTILMAIYLIHEYTFDQYHTKSSSIYRVVENNNCNTPYAMGEAFTNEIPEIENVFRIYHVDDAKIYRNNNTIDEHSIILADQFILEMLDISIVSGADEGILAKKNTLILSESMSRNYFPDENSVGKILKVNVNSVEMLFTITGVYKDFPSYSSLQTDFIGNIENAFESVVDIEYSIGFKADKELVDYKNNWDNYVFKSFIQVRPKANIKDVEIKCANICAERTEEKGNTIYLQPYSEMYLHSGELNNTHPFQVNQIQSLRIFMGIGLLILLVACVNFILISNSDNNYSIKEIACRKVNGASRWNIFSTSVLKSCLIAFLSLIPALLFVHFTLPIFNNLFQKDLSFSLLLKMQFILTIIGVTLLAGLGAGSYLGIYASEVSVVHLFQKNPGAKGVKNMLKGSLVIVQFMTFILLVTCFLFMQKQYSFSLDKDLGLNTNNILLAKFRSEEFDKHSRFIQNELIANPNVLSCIPTSFMTPPSDNILEASFRDKETGESMKQEVLLFGVGELEMLEIPMISGLSLSNETASNRNNIIINKVASEKYNVGVGENISHLKVCGIVENFHYHSLHNPIKPIFIIGQTKNHSTLLLKTNGNYSQVIRHLGEVCNELGSGLIFEFELLDDRVSQFYRKEERQIGIIGFFSIIAIILSVLGLFGFVSIKISRRSKEIGIRKVNGSKVSEVMVLLNKDFIKWLIIAFVIAAPVAYYIMNRWLENFAYKTTLSWWGFALAGALALGIALLTVSWQSWRAATRNPVEALRYE